MKTILRTDIPEDFIYYRTGSEIFHKYMKDFFWGEILAVGEDDAQFLRAERFLFGFWSTIQAEKIDREPQITFLKRQGYRHGLILWAPLRRQDKPKCWIRLPKFCARMFLHASRSAFSTLGSDGEYWKTWSSEARNHRKKTLQLIQKGTIRIVLSSDLHLFSEAYTKANIRDPYKKLHMQWLKRIESTQKMHDKRVYLGYIGDELVAGALFLDMGTTSEYFLSFYPPESRKYQFGIAFIDAWMRDSLRKGIRYCDFDHMRDIGNPRGQAGYTQFKSGIAEYDVYFHDLWIKIF